jgi:hypothetical protein
LSGVVSEEGGVTYDWAKAPPLNIVAAMAPTRTMLRNLVLLVFMFSPFVLFGF